MYTMLVAGFLLLGHYIADKVLQPGQMSQLKRDADPHVRWRWLLAHGCIHGFIVSLVLPPPFALLEVAAHAAIDRGKGRGWYGTAADQALHVLCKLVWVAVAAGWVAPTRWPA